MDQSQFKMSESETPAKFRHTISISRSRIVIIVLCVIIIALVITFAVVTTHLHQRLSSVIDDNSCSSRDQNINLDPPNVLPPFHDLTRDEIKSVKQFLYRQSDLNLAHAADIRGDRSFIYLIELHVPEKEQILKFLDDGGTAPVREAKVIIYRGDKPEPVVQEYIVGPLPHPKEKRSGKQRPFLYRPLPSPQFFGALYILKNEIHSKLGHIIEDSYGGKISDCSEKCLDFQLVTQMSPVSHGEPKARKIWFQLAPVVEYWSLHPTDFSVLIDVSSNVIEQFKIDKIYYANQMFNTVDDLLIAYESGNITKTKIPFPSKSKESYSSMNRRGTLFPKEPLLPPTEFEPSGKRYSINGRHIKYMAWSFDVRMSTISGPQIFDIRYNDKRIVYELSLQEVAVFYSGDSPSLRFADFIETSTLIGARARSLVSGADCPAHSTFLGTDLVVDFSEDPVHFDRSFCVFEHNTGVPLRRHLSPHGYKVFYEGMMDIVLTVRTIAALGNYDYIIDFIFHQNGALEVKLISTGYILTSFRYPQEDSYGFRLRDHMTGNIHHHMFHFKVDMDIHGQNNRFETIEITPEEVDNSKWSEQNEARYHQTKMVRQLIESEKEAAMKYNFDQPKYLTFYNNMEVSPLDVPRAYRLFTRSISKQMVKEGTGQEPSLSWARYQVAITKYKEEERRSSSPYAMFYAENPVVNFQSFIDDNENITDVDQVTWVTMGIHHIPHMEDIPVTHTVGLDLGFFLLPYNYFDEDPAMGSGDAIRIEPQVPHELHNGLKIETYGKSENGQCFPRQSTFKSDIKKNPNIIFD